MGATKLPHECKETLEKIVDETIVEFEEYQKLEQEQDVAIDNIKLYDKMVDIENYALSNNKDILDLKKQSYKYDIAVLNETHFIKKILSTHNKISYLIMFGVGTIFGMMSDKWLPYAHFIWELIKISK